MRSGQIYSARSAPSVGMVSIRHHIPVVWCQMCTIPKLGAAYGGNPRSERVRPFKCDQMYCMILCHDARNPELSAPRVPSFKTALCHTIFECHDVDPTCLSRPPGRGMEKARKGVAPFTSSPRTARKDTDRRRGHHRRQNHLPTTQPAQNRRQQHV